MTPSTAHACGTAAMAPRDQAGVVSSNLTVYGVTGLSVGDISIIPIIPATHPCATVYAIAEKAADLIKSRYDSSIPPAGSIPISTTTISTTASTITPVPTTSAPPTCTVAKYGQCDVLVDLGGSTKASRLVENVCRVGKLSAVFL
ncbi:hypothetical protein CVT25_000544 [Psilocybe cyanescens]|uniref:Glucose-methanol-choline oxidoreductase C-terminal domain-containing protein n=1 Tax=Psilocybe cyanescens TaxID=93625 RepID=A0A409WZN8_PSICY|nr:hypothetical protein CVT25_000544 [Psilocybe cyanescens]